MEKNNFKLVHEEINKMIKQKSKKYVILAKEDKRRKIGTDVLNRKKC